MTPEKAVFFEEINSAFYPIVKKYLNKDFTIYYFKIGDGCQRKLKDKKCLETERLIDLSRVIFEFVPVYKQASFYAHENVDYIFDKYFSSSPSIKNMEELLEFPEIENMYKYTLLRELENIYVTELKINEIAKKSSGEIHFYPSNNFKIHSDKSSLLPKNIMVINNSGFRMRLNNILTRTKEPLFLFAPIYVFLKIVKRISNNRRVKEFKVGIDVHDPVRIFQMKYYLLPAILVDDDDLPKDEVLFIDERGHRQGSVRGRPNSTPPNLKDYEKRGYNYIDLPDERESISSDLFWQKIVRRFIPTWFKSIFLSFWEQPLVTKTTRYILHDYIRWNIFADSYKIDNYVKGLNPDSISRTHILAQHNIQTWFIYPDNLSHDYVVDWDATKRNQTYHSFMYYDNIVVYGDVIERFFKKHRNHAKKYIKTGVLYSQLVHELQEGKLHSPISSIIQKKNLPKKRIGVFDTPSTDRGYLKIKGVVKFGNDIIKLLDELQDVGIIFKAAKWPGFMPDLDPIYDKLKNHERCLFFDMWNEEGVSAVEVIAESDLVISAAYTSPSAEALGAKKKAIYYDVTGHDIGDKYYFNRFPNFVAHNYDELKKLVHYWLYEVTDKDFEDFLNTYVKDEIDPYLDGKALSRLRKLLRE